MLSKNITDIAVRISDAILNLSGANKKYRIVKSKDRNVDVEESFEGKLFMSVANEVLSHKRTLMTSQRLHVLWQSVLNTRHIHGDAVEIGVFRGGSSYFLAKSYVALKAEPERMYSIDTFEGHADGTITDADTHHKVGMFADTSYESVKDYLSCFAFVNVEKGAFSSVARKLTSDLYRLVHIDTDLYQPTIDCLLYFMPKMSCGGVIVVDDYLARKCPGVTRAVNEFLKDYPVFDIWYFQTEQIALVYRPKNASIGTHQ